MLRYIRDNKQWIFSGIGVFVIGLIASGIYHFSGPRTSNQDAANVERAPRLDADLNKPTHLAVPTPEMSPKPRETTTPTIREAKMTEPTPMQIRDALSKLTTLQQEDVVRVYKGIRVEWELDFHSASRSDETRSDIIDIAFNLPGDASSRPTIWCWAVKFARYPEFKAMTPGRRVRVTGVIGHVDSGRIDIERVSFVFL